MSFNQFNRSTAQPAANIALDEGLRQHMLRVYNQMGIGVALTGLVAWLIANTPSLFSVFFMATGAPTILGYVAIFSPIVFILFFNSVAMRSSASVLQGMFWLFCAVMGVSMATIFFHYTGDSIARTFFVVAAMFGATSLYGYTTKRDMAQFGGFLTMGLIGLIIAGIVNFFLNSPTIYFAQSAIGVLIFTGFTAYDTQMIKQSYAEHYGQEDNYKIAVYSALKLYLDFINLFTSLLRFMGDRR